MLKVTLLFAAKKLSAPTLAGLQEYKKRLSQSCQLDWKTSVETPEGVVQNNSSGQIHMIQLDQNGQSYFSPELARQFQTWMTSGISQLVFYIGVPSHGYPPACSTLSLSPATLSSNTAGLLVTEQIYRAFRILEGKSYHK